MAHSTGSYFNCFYKDATQNEYNTWHFQKTSLQALESQASQYALDTELHMPRLATLNP